MNRTTLISHIGEPRFREACAQARQQGQDLSFYSDVPHDIWWLLHDSDIQPSDRLHTMLDIYRDMPCYTLLMYIAAYFDSFTPEDQAHFWSWARQHLEANDPQYSVPLAYALWCDFFEDPRYVAATWQALTQPRPEQQALETILIHSGPVPFELKQPLYAELMHDPHWHYFIYRSLLHSTFDVEGKVDRDAARELLQQLTLAPNVEHRQTLDNELMAYC